MMSSVFNTAQFQGFLEGQRGLIDEAYREVDELLGIYQGHYLAVKADRDRVVSALAGSPRFSQASPEDFGPTLESRAAARREVEQAAIPERTRELELNIETRQNEADCLLASVQQEAARVRELNPELDRKEEQLKADIAAGQQQLGDLNAEIAGLGRGLGFVVHGPGIYRLNRRRGALVDRLYASQRSLSDVRKEWKTASEAATQSEAAMLDRWRAAAAELGELRREHEVLARDPQALAWRRTCVFVLEDLTAVPADAPADAAAALRQVVDLNGRLAEFRAALGSVAGVLALANGMKQGLQAFISSVGSLQTQENTHRQYLSPLRIELAGETRAFGAVWSELAEKARDEKALAEHPADFVALAAPYLEGRLSQTQITAYFESLGAALKRATAAWSQS